MRRHEDGLILPALLILLLIGGIGAMLGGNDLAARVELHHHQATIAQLARARAALIGYAQSYHLTHPGQSVGYLPCPDMDSGKHDGNADGSCGSKGEFAIGRLPYRTLGLPPLRDGYGECLWYAVAGSFKNSHKGDTMDWDTAGQFSVSNGSHSQDPALQRDQLAVAVVFAPSRPLFGQTRSSSTRRCSGEADAKSALQAYLEGATAAPSSSTITLTRGLPTSNVNNDILVWISADDIFDASLIARSDYITLVDSMNARLKAAVIDLGMPPPQDARRVGLVDIGALPDAVLSNGIDKRWKNQFRYLLCGDGSKCLRWNDESGITLQCVAVIAFAGHRRPDQNRSDGISDATAFFEGDNQDAVNGVTMAENDDIVAFVGNNQYDGSPPTADVIQCIP